MLSFSLLCPMPVPPLLSFFFFFNDTATTEIYTLSLHDALPIYRLRAARRRGDPRQRGGRGHAGAGRAAWGARSEEHTSELQSPCNLVCRLLLEKKKKKKTRKKASKVTYERHLRSGGGACTRVSD